MLPAGTGFRTDFGHMLRDAAGAAGIAAALALPLLGFRLSDSPQDPPELRLEWVLYTAAAVFVGRLAVTYARWFWLLRRKESAPNRLTTALRRFELPALNKVKRWPERIGVVL